MDGGESVASGLNEGGFSLSPPVDFERFIKPTWTDCPRAFIHCRVTARNFEF